MKNSNKQFIKAASRETRALYFITKAKEIHGERYLYDSVLRTFVSQQKYVEIICPTCGPFQQLGTNHLAGKGCAKCAANERAEKRYMQEHLLAKNNEKICSSCGVVKSFNSFAPDPNGKRIGKVGSWCNECLSNKNKTIYKERIRKGNLKKYDLTLEQYDFLLKKQNHKCAICEIHSDIAPAVGVSKGGRLCVDHVHGTKKIRGLLCSRCNTGIGLFLENTTSLAKAIEYLNKNT
jgi:hypothetical protein